EPSSLFDFEEVMNNNHNQEPPLQNGPPPMVRPNGQAPRTMEECQPSINGRGGPIAPIPIQATYFGLRHHMIQQVQNTNSIHSFDDMMRKFLSKYFPPSMVTKLRKEITEFEQKPHESLFEAWERYKLSIDRFPNHNILLVTQIDTFYNGLTLSHRDTINAAAGGTFMQKTPKECYELIENMTAHHNHWDTSAIRDETSRNISFTSTIESPEVVRQLKIMNKNFLKMTRQFQTVKAVNTKYETCGGPHSFTECPAVDGYTQETAYATTGSLPSKTVPNPRADLKAITTRSGVTLAGPSVSPPLPSNEVDREQETITDQVTNDTVQPSTKNIQPSVVQTQVLIDELVVAQKLKPTIPYPSRANKQKLREKDDMLALKFLEIFKNLHFELSFTDALLHVPKFALMFNRLLNNKEKLFDLATTPMNENCSAVILKKLPEKIGDPGKFLIPCDWTGRALIDVYGEELTLRVDDEAITFKEHVQEVLRFSDNSKSGNSTPTSDLIIALSSPSLTPFEGGDFILEEIKACLTSKSIPSGIDDTDFDLKGDIRILEELLNKDPSLSPLPSKELNVEEIKTVKSSIDEPPELELKELPSHLEYAFLEGTDKLPVIISKELKDEEKSALLKDDFKPTVQDQRRVNPKIHEVIKKEVIKLLDAGLIYLIFDSPWVSPVHCVPKKGGMTIVENEDNELIPTRCGLRATKDQTFSAYTLCEQDYDGCSSTLHYDGKRVTSRSILLLQKFDVIIRDNKGAENLAADHLSRLENPRQDELEKKEITETFPLETLGMITFRGDSSTPWFTDFANYHAGNFVLAKEEIL
nr:reverse transcriptase domain-containing protein [Tanacetum cinerariifolium]